MRLRLIAPPRFYGSLNRTNWFYQTKRRLSLVSQLFRRSTTSSPPPRTRSLDACQGVFQNTNEGAYQVKASDQRCGAGARAEERRGQVQRGDFNPWPGLTPA